MLNATPFSLIILLFYQSLCAFQEKLRVKKFNKELDYNIMGIGALKKLKREDNLGNFR